MKTNSNSGAGGGKGKGLHGLRDLSAEMGDRVGAMLELLEANALTGCNRVLQDMSAHIGRASLRSAVLSKEGSHLLQTVKLLREPEEGRGLFVRSVVRCAAAFKPSRITRASLPQTAATRLTSCAGCAGGTGVEQVVRRASSQTPIVRVGGDAWTKRISRPPSSILWSMMRQVVGSKMILRNA